MVTGDKKIKLYFLFIVLFLIVIGFGLDLNSFLKDYSTQSVVEDRVIVVFSSNPKIYTDVVKRKGYELLVQARSVNSEELILFKKDKSFLLLPSRKMYIPIDVIDPELLVMNLLKSKKDKIKQIFKDCIEIQGKNRHIRIFFYGDHISKIEMYLNGLPYKTITYTYYKNTTINDSVFNIPKDYELPEKDESIFDTLNNYYESWCIKLFSPLIIEGFKDHKQSILIISKTPIASSLINELKKRMPKTKITTKSWKEYYIVSIGKTPFR